MGYGHKPVLLDEVIEALNIQVDGFYIDATFGRGGHSREILKRLGPKGRLLAFDKDPDAVNAVDDDLVQDSRFEIVQDSFTMLMAQTIQRDVSAKVAGLLFDLGVSSPQFDDASRGFSFRFDAPLDMRMDTTAGRGVADWLKDASETEIAKVIFEYGEERSSRRIARAIVKQRGEAPIRTTAQLAELVSRIVPARKTGRMHPATKTFQALRIFINRELDNLKHALAQVAAVLKPGGRLVVISFHSLEDRIVKRFIRDESRPGPIPPELPVRPDQGEIKLAPIGNKIRATAAEININPRSRSAIMRVAERC